MNIAVIGGGASGLTAAIAAARSGARVTVYEKLPRVGKKLLATGNGRCNLSNIHIDPLRNYRSGSPAHVQAVLAAFSPGETLCFFEELGIPVREGEEGKLYPYSLQAASVLDVLRFELESLRAETVCGQEVLRLERGKDGFLVEGAPFDRVVVATGGLTAPPLGGGRSGYGLLASLGHDMTPLRPSIVQLKADMSPVRGTAGVKTDGVLTFYVDDRARARERGEILFTEYGLSGPAALRLSCALPGVDCAGGSVRVELDCLPDLGEAQLMEMLDRRAREHPERLLEHFFVGLLPKRLGLAIVKQAGRELRLLSGALTPSEVRGLADTAKRMSLHVTGTMGYQDAQVTSGGANLTGFSHNLESLRAPGLFACGEVLDVDGDCGGYNLQWAWSSGMVAGTAAAGGVLC